MRKKLGFFILVLFYTMPKLKPGTKTLADLKKEAQGLQIRGRSKMNKKELMAAVDEAKGIETEITKDVPKDVPKDVSEDEPKEKKRVKRDESPTRIDKEKMKELKKTSRGRNKTPKMREVKKDDDKDSMKEKMKELRKLKKK